MTEGQMVTLPVDAFATLYWANKRRSSAADGA